MNIAGKPLHELNITATPRGLEYMGTDSESSRSRRLPQAPLGNDSQRAEPSPPAVLSEVGVELLR